MPAALVAQARERPSSWVYELDENAPDDAPVCAAQIRRAWRTDATGAIVADGYVDNPYYQPAVPAPRRRPRTGVVVAAGAVVLLIAAAVVVFGEKGSSHSATTPTARAHPASAPLPTPLAGAVVRTQVRRAQARPAVVQAPAVRHRPPHRARVPAVAPQLSLRANAPLWVCLQGVGGRVLIAGQTLAAGQTLPAVRGSVFEIFAGNGAFTIVVNGVAHRASGSPDPVAYRVSAGRVTQLPGYPAQPCA